MHRTQAARIRRAPASSACRLRRLGPHCSREKDAVRIISLVGGERRISMSPSLKFLGAAYPWRTYSAAMTLVSLDSPLRVKIGKVASIVRRVPFCPQE